VEEALEGVDEPREGGVGAAGGGGGEEEEERGGGERGGGVRVTLKDTNKDV